MSELALRVELERGGFRLDVDLALPGSGVTSLFGPSGSGKTTLLRCLAGFERGARGRVALGEAVWLDDARGVDVAPWHRPVAMVFQEPGLFPHLSVWRNLEYAWRRAPSDRRRVQPDDAVAWLGIEALLERVPESLSGGERQRVAIARALLANPRILLLDEPLASLDRAGARAILPFLEELPTRLAVPIVHVSHSMEEVARLADRIVWLEDGRVRRIGPAAELASSLELAAAVAAPGSVLEARVERHDDGDWLSELSFAGGTLLVRRLERPVGARVRVHVPAADVSLARDREARSSLLNELACTVAELAESGPGEVSVRLRTGASGGADLLARVTARSARTLELAPGEAVYARVKSVALL